MPDGAAVQRYASHRGGSDSRLSELRLRAAPREADHPADGGKSGAQACFIDTLSPVRSDRAGEIGLDIVLHARKAWQLAGGAPLAWSAARKSLEDRGEMRLRLEAYSERDLDNGHSAVAQQRFGLANAAPQNEFMRPEARCHPELGGKVHSAQPRDCRQIQERDLVRQMNVDIFEDPLEAPFL